MCLRCALIWKWKPHLVGLLLGVCEEGRNEGIEARDRLDMYTGVVLTRYVRTWPTGTSSLLVHLIFHLDYRP